MSAPPSPPARIGAQAVHQPPWLARVSAATPYLAGSAISGDVEASRRRIRHRRGPDPWRERRRSRTGTDGGYWRSRCNLRRWTGGRIMRRTTTQCCG